MIDMYKTTFIYFFITFNIWSKNILLDVTVSTQDEPLHIIQYTCTVYIHQS